MVRVGTASVQEWDAGWRQVNVWCVKEVDVRGINCDDRDSCGDRATLEWWLGQLWWLSDVGVVPIAEAMDNLIIQRWEYGPKDYEDYERKESVRYKLVEDSRRRRRLFGGD